MSEPLACSKCFFRCSVCVSDPSSLQCALLLTRRCCPRVFLDGDRAASKQKHTSRRVRWASRAGRPGGDRAKLLSYEIQKISLPLSLLLSLSFARSLLPPLAFVCVCVLFIRVCVRLVQLPLNSGDSCGLLNRMR